MIRWPWFWEHTVTSSLTPTAHYLVGVSPPPCTFIFSGHHMIDITMTPLVQGQRLGCLQYDGRPGGPCEGTGNGRVAWLLSPYGVQASPLSAVRDRSSARTTWRNAVISDTRSVRTKNENKKLAYKEPARRVCACSIFHSERTTSRATRLCGLKGFHHPRKLDHGLGLRT